MTLLSYVDECCKSYKGYMNGLYMRSISLLVFGVITMIPFVEYYISAGLLGLGSFAIASSLVISSIYYDHEDKRMFGLWVATASGLLIFTLMLPSTVATSYLLISSLSMLIVSLFLSDESIKMIMNSLWFLSSQPHNSESLFVFPSSTKVILLFVIINMSISLGSLLAPSAHMFPCVIHDALTVLGSYNLASWLRYSLQTSLVTHNHSNVYVDVVNGDRSNIPVSMLREGMHVNCKEVALPVVSLTLEECHIHSDSAEQVVKVDANVLVKAHTTIQKGLVKCLSNYEKTGHIAMAHQTDDTDDILNYFLIATLTTALVSGFYFGFMSQSVLFGLQKFCLNLILACPCAFLASRSILNSKVVSYIKDEIGFHFCKMPNIGLTNIVVFDRTRTLYYPDDRPIYSSSDHVNYMPYKLMDGALSLLQRIKNMKIDRWIISGHATNSWETNLSNCKKDLRRVVDKEKIIFSDSYHDEEKAEKQYAIKNLQLYGSEKQPQYLYERLWIRASMLFRTNAVTLVGDGANDAKAMQQADLSIGVSRSDNRTYNDNVALSSHFLATPQRLVELPKLLKALDLSDKLFKCFFYAAFAFISLMLCLANLAPTTLVSTSTLCMASFMYCVFSSSAALLINFESLYKFVGYDSCFGKEPKSIHYCTDCESTNGLHVSDSHSSSHGSSHGISCDCCESTL